MQTLRFPARTLLALSVVFAGHAIGGQHDGSLGVSAQVVAPHQPALAANLPMPVPGHVMQEDTRGRHYFFEGDVQAASLFLDAEMRLRGYALSARRDMAQGQALRWFREGNIVDAELRAVRGIAPTRVSLRVTVLSSRR